MKLDLSQCTPFERKCALLLQQVNGDESARVYIEWCRTKKDVRQLEISFEGTAEPRQQRRSGS